MKKILCTLFFVTLVVLLCGCSGKPSHTEQLRDLNEVSFALYTEPPAPEQRKASGKTTRGGDITLSVKINSIGISEEYVPHHVIVEITLQTGNYTFDRTFAEAYAKSGGIDELTFTLSQVAAENLEYASFDVSVSTLGLSPRNHLLSNNNSYFSYKDYKILHSEDEDSTAGMPPSVQTHSSPALQYVQTRPFCIV